VWDVPKSIPSRKPVLDTWLTPLPWQRSTTAKAHTGLRVASVWAPVRTSI
jgi:hypothetical protein